MNIEVYRFIWFLIHLVLTNLNIGDRMFTLISISLHSVSMGSQCFHCFYISRFLGFPSITHKLVDAALSKLHQTFCNLSTQTILSIIPFNAIFSQQVRNVIWRNLGGEMVDHARKMIRVFRNLFGFQANYLLYASNPQR